MSGSPQARTRLVRILHNHGRLFLSAAFGLATYLFLVMLHWRVALAVLIGWDIGVAIYLGQAFVIAMRSDLKRLRERAARYDEGGLAILALTVIAAVASLGAIVSELGMVRTVTTAAAAPYFALAVATIVLSWTFVHTIFAFHYAHEYYGEGRDRRAGGLVFPEDDKPDYWDFAYFSFVVGMTFQVSDVQVTSKSIRRVVVAHGVVSFVFNVAILALVVNLGANVI